MRDSKPQRCVQHHKSLKVTQNALNRDKHINEASKQTFANNLFWIICKCMQGMVFNRNICGNAFNLRNYDEFVCILSKINETVQKVTYTNVPVWCQLTTKTTFKCRFNLGPIFKHEFEIKKLGQGQSRIHFGSRIILDVVYR